MDVTAVCERSGDWWSVSVPEVEGAFTQAKRLEQVPAMVADAVSLLTGVPVADVKVTVAPRIPDSGAMNEWNQARILEAAARRVQDAAAQASRGALSHLRDLGLSTRDIGQLTGVSYQRVSQLLADVGVTTRAAVTSAASTLLDVISEVTEYSAARPPAHPDAPAPAAAPAPAPAPAAKGGAPARKQPVPH
jgi:predicted RNase H-like HicB family nuclease